MTIQPSENDPGQEAQGMSGISRREACRRLGLMGMVLMLGGCQSAATPGPAAKRDDPSSYPVPPTPEQFESLVGTVQATRAKAATSPEAASDFIRRFVSFSPRILAAKRPGGVIGSVLVDPAPTTVELGVNLQLARERLEPAILHDDLGGLAARQYWRSRKRYFAATVPNTVNIFGESIHKDRFILQLTVGGELPPDKIVHTNQDLESLLGRQLTFARLVVKGLDYPGAKSPVTRKEIWIDDVEGRTIPENKISVTLLVNLIRLEMTGTEVRAISPKPAGESPSGWQDVSEAYYNFAVGQMIESERAVALYAPRNAFETTVMSGLLNSYRAALVDSKKRLNWDEAHAEAYESQKHSKVDLLTQQVFLDI